METEEKCRARRIALQSLKRALVDCLQAGIEVRVTPLYQQGDVHTMVVLECVEIREGELWARPKEAGQ